MTYSTPERIIDLDAVTEQLYEGGNLCEEVYRALGGDALPFYQMLGKQESGLGADLRDAARAYLENLRDALVKHDIYGGGGGEEKVAPRELVIERLTPNGPDRSPVFRDAKP